MNIFPLIMTIFLTLVVIGILVGASIYVFRTIPRKPAPKQLALEPERRELTSGT